MYYVYLLRSLKDSGWYIGMSNDLKRRFYEHNAGKGKSTRYRKPFTLLYYEAYLDKRDAAGREKFLKSGSGRRFLKKQLKHFLNGQ